MTTLYESPSGSPVVIPDPPAPFEPEVGAILRQDKRTFSHAPRVITTELVDVGDNGGDAWSPVLLLPKADRLYSAELDLDILISEGETAQQYVIVRTFVSVDDATWSLFGNPFQWSTPSGTQPTEEAVPSSYSRHLRVPIPPTLGSDFGVVPGSPSIRFKAQIQTAMEEGGEASTITYESFGAGTASWTLTEQKAPLV